MPVLHESSPLIIWMGRSIKTVVAKPELIGPLLEGDTDADGYGASIYGSVIQDGGMFRMWYQAWPRKFDSSGDAATVAYAESANGLNWKKPILSAVELNGDTKNNLINLPFHSPSVFIDPTAPDSHRYRATGFSAPYYRMNGEKAVNAMGYFTAHSADGINWTLDSREPRWGGNDVISSCWDAHYECGHVLLKRAQCAGGIWRRMFQYAQLKDGEYSNAYTQLVPDEFDDVKAYESGGYAGDYYGMGWSPQGEITQGILWNYHIDLPMAKAAMDNYRPMGLYGQIDFSVVWRDHPQSCWRHLRGRPRLQAVGEYGRWTGGTIYSASATTLVGDEEWLYITGCEMNHGDYLTPEWKTDDKRWEVQSRTIRDKRIGLLKWGKGRLTGLQTTLCDEIHLSIGSLASGRELTLNATTLPQGSIRAEVISLPGNTPMPGYTMEDAVPFCGDSQSAPVAWKGGARLPEFRPDNRWHLRLYLERATIHGYEIVSEE